LAHALYSALKAKGAGGGYGTPDYTQGPNLQWPSSECTRGRVFYGMLRDELREFCQEQGVNWSIQDGQLTFIPLSSYIPGEVPVISSTTGLIGVPEQTADGIKVKLLLNPTIKIGHCVKLDNRDIINKFRFGLDLASQKSNPALSTSIKTNADGLFYVMVANHFGDTRG